MQHGDRDATLQSTISPADSSVICVGKMKLTQLKIELQTQSRVAINQDAVKEYANAMMDGTKFPPITAFHDGKHYYLADGYHRYFAAKKAGLEEIDCKIIKGTLRDAILHSVGVNADHGLQRTNEDKRKAVMKVLDDLEWSEWSDNVIANTCAVSGAYVGRIRKTLNLQVKEKKYIDKQGKTSVINIENIGKKELPPELPKELPEDDDQLQELADANVELAEENTLLKDRLAIASVDATPEEKIQLTETMEQLRAIIKRQEAEITVLKSSRDGLQQKNADMLKQLAYWKKRAEKAA